MSHDDSTNLTDFPCPVCKNCDHDLRGGLLELFANVKENYDEACNALLDAMEADGEGAEAFGNAIVEFSTVRHQMSAILDVIPDIARIKAASV